MSIAMINDILFGKFGECTIGNTFSDSAEKTSGFEISVRNLQTLTSLLVDRGGMTSSDSAKKTSGFGISMRGIQALSGLPVDRGGIEPPTHGFSVHCSTN